MAHPDANLPLDKDVVLPPSVKAAAAAADAAHAAAYTPQPDTPAPVPPPQPDTPAPVPPPQPNPPPVPDAGEAGSWEHRYRAMKGRYDQSQVTIGSMQETMQELGDELTRTQALLQMPARERAAQPGRDPGSAPRKLITDKDVETYSPELIDLMQRAALDAVTPALDQTTNQVRQVSQRVGNSARNDMLAALTREVPTWQQINLDDRFKSWCRSVDVYSGQVRSTLLNQAFQAANAPRVVAFFKGFLAEEQATGQLPVPQPPAAGAPPAPRQAAVALESLTAPGRPKPAGGDSPAAAADKPVFTRAQVSGFYASVRRGEYVGKEADKQRDEEMIFAAQRDGRIRG